MPTAADGFEGLIKNRRRPGYSRRNDPVNTSGENDPDESDLHEQGETKAVDRAEEGPDPIVGGAHYSDEDRTSILKKRKEQLGY